MKSKIIVNIILVIIATACTKVAAETPPQESEFAAPSTFAPEATKTPLLSTITAIATSTITPPADALDLSDITSGQYVLIGDPGEESLYIVSTDKQVVKAVSLQSYNAEFAASDDGTQFLLMRPSPESSVLLNVSTGISTLLSIDQGCQSASWSPDKQFIALSCITSDIGEEIFIFDTVSKQLLQMTECHNIYKYCSFPSWSTNGHWLAYYESDERSGEHPRGIKIVDTTCFKANNCMKEQMGLIEADSNPVWSIQNQLVYVKSDFLSFLEIKDWRLDQVYSSLLPDITENRTCGTIKFSPDGNYLACTVHNTATSSVYLYSPNSNTIELIFSNQSLSLNLIGWIKIP